MCWNNWVATPPKTNNKELLFKPGTRYSSINLKQFVGLNVNCKSTEVFKENIEYLCDPGKAKITPKAQSIQRKMR